MSKFNRKGNGPEEYTNLMGGAVYDDKKDELFIVARGISYQIKVYDHLGNFKRVLDFPEESRIWNLADWDENSLLLYDAYREKIMVDLAYDGKSLSKEIECEDCYSSSFIRVSKEDGTLIESIPIVEDYSYIVGKESNGMFISKPLQSLVKYNDGYLLCSRQTDTIYYYTKDASLTPVWVTIPPAKDMVTKDMVNGFVEAGKYQFFEKIILEGDDLPIPTLYLVRDKETDNTYTQKIVFDEYKGYNFTVTQLTVSRTSEAKIGCLFLDTSDLKEAYNENRLSGQLKELVKDMNEEDNPILMVLHFI
ncbi:MAG: 6-bladed beta-propeller [Tannerellaceae bacterium]|nr:6-bladed beta-propeller [Tannerellaceae bacterium]